MAEPPTGRLRLTVYSREYCHLCDDMLSALEALSEELDFDLDTVDVDADPALERRFGELVPVLMHGERELAHGRVDPTAVRAYFRDFG